jgi:hypothetical protein
VALLLAVLVGLVCLGGVVHSQVGTPSPQRYFYDTQWRRWPAPPEVANPPVPPPAAPSPAIVQVQALQRAEADRATPLGSPDPDAVFRRESEARLRARMAAEARQAGRPLPRFPQEPALPEESGARHPGPAPAARVEPAWTCYERLMFEQKNAERYGWDLGVVAPLVATGGFYLDVLTAPVRRLVEPCRAFDCNAGYCLPDDPVPYRVGPLFPPGH